MLIAALLLSTVAPWETDLVARARTGRVLCVNPDAKQRTCTAIDTYTVASDGTITDVEEVLLSRDPVVTLEATYIIKWEDGAACGTLGLADIRRGRVRMNGAVLPPARNAAELEILTKQFAPLAGRKICDTLLIVEGQLFKQGRIAGSDIELPQKPVAWLDPADGYTVGPR